MGPETEHKPRRPTIKPRLAPLLCGPCAGTLRVESDSCGSTASVFTRAACDAFRDSSSLSSRSRSSAAASWARSCSTSDNNVSCACGALPPRCASVSSRAFSCSSSATRLDQRSVSEIRSSVQAMQKPEKGANIERARPITRHNEVHVWLRDF